MNDDKSIYVRANYVLGFVRKGQNIVIHGNVKTKHRTTFYNLIVKSKVFIDILSYSVKIRDMW